MQGGIGVHSAAACRAMGAAGVIFEDQLLLLAESPLPEALQNELTRLNGAETRLFGELVDLPCRVYSRPGTPALKAAESDNNKVESGDLSLADWRRQLTANLGWNGGEQFMPIGQGIGLAATYRSQYRSVGRFIQAVRKASLKHVESAVATGFMAPGGALAKSHGTSFPIAQGPMTRVSDSPEFAYQVSKNGALPFLALALYRGPQVLEMLQQTKARMTQADGSVLPWGVGLLGFVPHSLREEQIAAVWQCKPTYALIAGGRPDQAAHFEKEGIPTYIHAPAPALLRMYIEQGAKRFVFEGRECGGHIGPLASFPLWEQMIEVLLADVKPGTEAGIHNAASGAMLAALAAPLAARGMKVGCIMGTAYLFTQEIVDSGAVVKGFRDAAISCDKTVNFETGPGHSTRCVDTPFFREFRDARKELLREGVGADELRDRLEDMNMGRMRVASKGLNRNASGQIVEVSEADQYKDGMFMIGQVATMRNDVVTLDALHREVTEGGMAMLRAVVAGKATRKQEAKPSDIAIVGVGTLLPKATNAEKYWENIVDQVCVIGEVPKDRWDWKMYFDADRRARDKVYSRWGGFLDEVAFDPISYGIPPKSMKSIDPMQLLTLEVTRRALADAGMADGDFDRENTSVILGAGGGLGDLGTQYAVRAELPRFVDIDDKTVWERLPEWTEESFAGTLLNVAAGRVTNRMDFGGLNFTIDAACASSLAAISIAVNELESGRTSVAIAGGIDTVQSPFGFLCFSKTQALSPNGKPKTFDTNADGIAISEGLAVIVLKRLADAEAAGDRIYAVIKSVAGSSDGRALGLTAPRPEGQKLALKRAYARAGFSPASLGMAEAHGTGTPVGDKAEARTITESLAAEGAAPKTVAISSVKTLLGHTKASAGVSGLIKVAMSLYHRTLPAHYGVEKPIDIIADPNAPVYLLKDARPWLAHPDHPRRGGVSAFGFGGTNFHAVLEEYAGNFGSASPAGAARWPQELFVFRAKDEAQLAADLGRFVAALRVGSNVRFRDLAYSLTKQAESRSGSPLCLALVAKDFASLLADLEATIASLAGNGKPLPPSARFSKNVPTTAPQLGFLFPGQGSQYVNMGRETALYVEELRGALEFADATLRSEFPALLSRTILPPAAFDAEAEATQGKALTNTRVVQPAIGALSLGYTRLAERLGLTAVAAAGHSYGEYAALHAAGALSATDFLKLSAVRGQCMADAAATSEPGAMAAVQARRETVAAAIAGIAGVKIANHNAPEQAVISGPAAGVEQAVKALEAIGVRVTRLAVSGAFHTELVASAQTGLSAAIAASAISVPRIAVYSNTTAQPYPANVAGIRKTLDGHLLNSVEFVAEIEAMYAAGVRVFAELGPKGTCANMARATLAGKESVSVSFDGNGGGIRGLLLGLADLVVAGVPVALTRLFDGRDPQALDLGKLADLIKPDVIPKHAWMVSGGCAREQSDSTFRTGKLPAYDAASLAAMQAKLKSERTVIVQSPASPSFVAPTTAAPPASHPAAAITPALGAEALAAYQQTMRQFLQLQERVVSQYLSGGNAAAAPSTVPAMPVLPVAAPIPVVPVAAATPAAPAVTARVEAPKAVVAAPAPVAAAASFDPTAALLEIVADRTGYPQDMLGLDQDLEAELGIDSIKRVEILGALQKSLPAAHGDAMQAGMERFTRARSLNAILDAVSALAAPAAAAPVAAAAAVAVAAATSTASETIPRFVPRSRRVPLPAKRHAIAGLYLLTADADGIAAKLARRIDKAGGKAAVIAAADATDPAALAKTLDALRKQHGKVAGLVHLAPLDVVDTRDLASWKLQSSLQAKALFWLLQQTMSELAAGPSVALAASRFGGSLGREAEGSSQPQAGAAVGLFNCATQEIPSLRARLVDFEATATTDAIVDALLDELAVDEARTEIGYADGQRHGYTHAPEDLADHPFAPHLAPSGDWVVLITGGARGITAEIAEELVRPGMRLVLLGRTALPGVESASTAGIATEAALKKTLLTQALAAGRKPTPVELERELRAVLADREIRGNIAKLTARGAVVDYRACDVRNPAVFGSLIDALYGQYGRIDAVLHGAGVIEDKRIPDKTPDSFDRVYDTKVDSAWTLATRLRPEGLQLLALFTSVSGRFGNTGQSDYAAANETLNRLAWQLQQRWNGVRVISVNWGPWDAGMASQQVRDAFRARNITPIPVAAGRRWFIDELAYGQRKDVELVAGAGPWDRDRGADAAEAAAADTGGGPLPLIREALKMGAGGAVVLEQVISLVSDPYLGDHRLDTKPVMPAATALEYIAQFAAAGWPEWQVVEIRDLRAFSGIVLDGDGSEKTLLLKARSSTHSDAGSQAVTVELFDPPRKTPNYRASVILRPQVPEAPLAEPVAALTTGAPMDTTKMYAEHLFHGPQFQLVTEVACMSMEGIDATVVATSPAAMLGAGGHGRDWLFDFGLVDTGPQLALVWGRVMHGKTALPSSFGKVARYGNGPVSGPLRIVIRMKPAAHDAGVRYDMQFIDASGRVRLKFSDAESTMSAALNRLAGNS